MSQRIAVRGLWRYVCPQFKQQSLLLNLKRSTLPACTAGGGAIHSDVTKTSKAVIPGLSADILMQNLRSATDSSDILFNVKQHHAIMNEEHALQALQAIFTLQKSHNSSMSNGEIAKSDKFQTLCKVVQKTIRFMELNDQLNVLKTLSFVGVVSTSKLMQVVLQLVAKQVNALTLQQVVFLDFIIKDFAPCPLVDALRIALPIVFEAHFRLQKDGCDVKQLAEFFVFSNRRGVSEQCIDSFIDIFYTKRDELDVETCKTILRVLTDAKRTDLPFRNLLHLSLDIIIDNIERISFYDVNYILARLTSNYNKNLKHFYHEEFVNSCAAYVVKHRCDDEQTTWIVRSCNRFRHTHKGLIYYMCEMVSENPARLEKWSVGMLVTFLEALANSDHKPDDFTDYQDLLINSLIKYADRVELPWMRAALSLCVLDCWPEELFKKIFQKSFLRKFLKRESFGDSLELLDLHQAIRTLRPSYNGPLPPADIVSKIIAENEGHSEEYSHPLLGALEAGLSGPSYVCSSLNTRLGHFVDHAVVMRKGGYPVAVNLGETDNVRTRLSLENLQVPEDSQVILVLYLTPGYYTLNTERIRGQIRLRISVLEAMGYSVVTITHSVWENLLDGEKIPYLMQALKNKCNGTEPAVLSQTQ